MKQLKLLICVAIFHTSGHPAPAITYAYTAKTETSNTCRAIKKTSRCIIASALGFTGILSLLQYATDIGCCGEAKPCTNQELLNLFNTIKQDLNVSLPIDLYTTKNTDFMGIFIVGLCTNSRIILNLDNIKNNKSKMIHVICHELGHALQYQQTAGVPSFTMSNVVVSILLNSIPTTMYNFLEKTGVISQTLQHFRKLETSADTVAAKYQNCQDCLKFLQLDTKQNPYQQERSSMGYFSPKDYQIYINNCIKNNARCPAHQKIYESKITAQKFTTQNKLFSKLYSKINPTIKPETFTFSDFLPTNNNRTNQ